MFYSGITLHYHRSTLSFRLISINHTIFSKPVVRMSDIDNGPTPIIYATPRTSHQPIGKIGWQKTVLSDSYVTYIYVTSRYVNQIVLPMQTELVCWAINKWHFICQSVLSLAHSTNIIKTDPTCHFKLSAINFYFPRVFLFSMSSLIICSVCYLDLS